MIKISPWVFMFFFLIIISIWMWNNFELPKFYPFEKTKQAIGLVIENKKVHSKLPNGLYDQKVKFVFETNQDLAVSDYRAYSVDMFKNIGDSIIIEYSVKNPKRCKYIRPYNYKKNKNSELKPDQNFAHTKKDGYKNLILVKSLFTYEDYAEYGKRLIKTTGIFKKTGDTIKLTSLVYYDDRKVGNTLIEEMKPINKQSEKFKISDFLVVSNNHIVEMSTGCNFKLSGSL